MDASKVTIEQICKEWLNMKRLIVKQSTYAKYDSVVRKHILPELVTDPSVQSKFFHAQRLCGSKAGKRAGH